MQQEKRPLMRPSILGILLLALYAFPANAQQTALTHYTAGDLATKAAALKTQADHGGNGVASETLETYPGHLTMLAFRDGDGGAELHKKIADLDFILDGEVTLITGGSIEEPKDASPDEVRGKSVTGGQKTILHKGDVIHIPANVPHQMLVAPGQSVTYFVTKVAVPEGQQP